MFSAVRHFAASCFSCMSRAVDDQPQPAAGAAHELAASTINLTILINDGSPSVQRRANDEIADITSPKAPEGHPALSPAPREGVAASEQDSFLIMPKDPAFDRVLFLSESPLKRSPAIRRKEPRTDSPIRTASPLAVPRIGVDEPLYSEIIQASPRAEKTVKTWV